ncbi:hypothetical protein MANI_028887 [Metarhizium anisopliae]|nr:hypothetical protein MANI_028887 [Metarhizium anisopliae]
MARLHPIRVSVTPPPPPCDPPHRCAWQFVTQAEQVIRQLRFLEVCFLFICSQHQETLLAFKAVTRILDLKSTFSIGFTYVSALHQTKPRYA